MSANYWSNRREVYARSTYPERQRALNIYFATHSKFKRVAERHRFLVLQRLRRLARQAGIDTGDCMLIHLHNCQASNRWSGVDYTIICEMQRIVDTKLFRANKLLCQWESRRDPLANMDNLRFWLEYATKVKEANKHIILPKN